MQPAEARKKKRFEDVLQPAAVGRKMFAVLALAVVVGAKQAPSAPRRPHGRHDSHDFDRSYIVWLLDSMGPFSALRHLMSAEVKVHLLSTDTTAGLLRGSCDLRLFRPSRGFVVKHI